jgi:hypothetical protein
MASVAVRVPKETFEVIRRVAEERQQTMGRVVADFAAEHERRQFQERARASVARFKQDEAGWQAMVDEHRMWDGTLLDGLEE